MNETENPLLHIHGPVDLRSAASWSFGSSSSSAGLVASAPAPQEAGDEGVDNGPVEQGRAGPPPQPRRPLSVSAQAAA